MRILLCTVGAIVASLLTACGSGSNNTAPADVRLVNTAPTPITMTLNGGYPLTGIATNSASGYAQVPAGTYTVSVSSANGSLNPSSQTAALGTNEGYTTIAYARGNSVYSSTITDNLAVPAVGFSTLDVANVSPDAGPLDVYLLPPGTTSLTPSFSPNFIGVSYQAQSTATTFTSGSWNVIVTGTGNQSDVRLSLIGANGTGAITLTSQFVGNLALTDTAGGALVNAVVIQQGQQNVVGYPNAQSRLRLMSAVATTSPVVLTTSGGTVIGPTYAPNQSGYVVVPAGESIASITVNGVGITAPAGVLAAGNDYSVLAYTNGASVATMYTDSNQLNIRSASVRVINGAISPADGVSVSYGGLPIANTVTLGNASSYYGLQPSASAVLTVNGSGYTYAGAQPAFDPPVGSVWTILVTSATAPVQLFRDR